jgi:hypothetical protein
VKTNALAREALAPKDANGNVISAQTFTFRELATATRNFRPECFLGEGGFGRVYKGRLDSTGQVTYSGNYELPRFLLSAVEIQASSKLHCCRILIVCLNQDIQIVSAWYCDRIPCTMYSIYEWSKK